MASQQFVKKVSIEPEHDPIHSVHDKLTYAKGLLAFETAVREIDNERELIAHFVNAPRRFLPFRQAFYFKRQTKNGAFVVDASSSIAIVDRNVPFIRWLEKIVGRLEGDCGLHEARFFSIPAYCDPEDEEIETYPFAEFLWTPLFDGDVLVGGYLTSKENAWGQEEAALAERFGALYVHALKALRFQKGLVRKKIFTKKRTSLLMVAFAIIGLIPVHMTALAPSEIISAEPFIVTAPFDGVVKEVLVDQGAIVDIGTSIVAFEDVQRRNDFIVADEKEAVAEARYLRASQSALDDPRTKRDVAITKTEFELAKAEKVYAADLFEKTILKSETSGIAIYTDKRDWIGRPVAAGEAIVEIADPTKVLLAIDLPTKDSLVIEVGAKVKVFLDSNPMQPITAEVTEIAYQARVDKRNTVSYRLTASLSGDLPPPRIGGQGIAKVYGKRAPFAYAVLRRPLASFRQLTGW